MKADIPAPSRGPSVQALSGFFLNTEWVEISA
jgi:hypothetical protein